MRIVAIAAAVPQGRLVNGEFGLSDEDRRKYEENTGILARHVVKDAPLTTLDLCEAAARSALNAAGWGAQDVDGVILVTQTPEYLLPASACILQKRLMLGKTVVAFDVNLGCSGYTYGLILAQSLLQCGVVHRCLLAVGDVMSRHIDQVGDRFLFGDAGAATLLDNEGPTQVRATCWGTDGTGAPYLIIPAGGQRSRVGLTCRDPSPPPCLRMDGAQVFVFALQRAVPAVKQLLKETGWTPEDVTAVVFHQASRFILDNVARRCKIAMERVPLSLDHFGNTSSASIPLTMVVRMADQLRTSRSRLLLVGFGVGWSWSGVAIETQGVSVAPLVELSGTPTQGLGHG